MSVEEKSDNLTLEARGNLSGFLTIIMWSSSGLLLAMTGNIPAFQLALLTLPFPFVVTLIKWKITGEDVKEHFNHPWYLYLLGVLGIGGYTILWYLGFKFAPPFEANLINYTWPFLILVFSFFILKEKMILTQAVGTIISFVGLIMLFYNGGHSVFNVDFAVGYFFAFAGAVVWALYSVFVKLVKGFGSNVISICCLISGIPILMLHLTFEEFVMPQGFEWIGLIGLILSRVSYLFWNFAMKYGNINIIVGISYFTPLFSSVLLIVFQYASNVGLSALFILFGSIVISWAYIKKAIAPKFENSSS